MRTIAFAAALTASTFLASSAYAADLPVKMPVKAPPAAGYSWTGFYLGVNAGYGVARDPSTVFDFSNTAPGSQVLADTLYLSPEGWLGGVQAGYNYQIDRWVFGVEADFQGGAQKDSVCLVCTASNGAFLVDQKLPWFATVRGRIGWATGRIYSYFTGGWAYGRVETSGNAGGNGSPPVSSSVSDNRSGWTIGTGLEAALAGNWTAKVEYLYMSLGSTQLPFFNSGNGNVRIMATGDIRDRIIRAGLNYRFGPTTGTGSATFPAPTFNNWAGFYVGGNGGYGVGRNSDTLPVTNGVLALNDQWKESPGGYFGGAQIGYSWQAASFVYGLETDFQGTGMKDSIACVGGCGAAILATESVEQKMPWFGTVRGRLGYSTGPALFYLTGGLAYGEVKTTLTETANASGFVSTASASETKTGWTIGAGAEAPIWGNWTAKTEYLYVDLGDATLNFSNTTPLGVTSRTLTSDIRAHIFRGGVNYHF